MNQKGIKHFIEKRACATAHYGTGDSLTKPLPELVLEAMTEDLGYLEGEERQIYTSQVLRYYGIMGVKVPADIARLLKD